ncbi:uncharacterized protein LOC142564544 [Dermacentor variabilis]|uniref:uncharacterized protein LOC142564544 n=1 Tax=Dermacentor variabilis TaxID=34621 RepID=UPI003F5BDFFD
MADVFEDDAFAVAKQVLADAVDDLEGSLSQLGRDARVAMRESTRSMMAETAGDPQYLTFSHDILSQDEGDDVKVVLVDSYHASVENMTLFSSQARFGDRNRRRVLLVTPGLLGLLVNASSSVEPVLVPALAKPLLHAMLTNRQAQTISDAVPPVRILNKLTRCFTTWFNVSQSLSPEVAAELAVLEPLFQLYRKRLTESVGTDTVLHASYTNQQLFFLLWAHGHCGDPNGRVLVNVVSRNYPRFGRTFRCSAAKVTAHEKKLLSQQPCVIERTVPSG